MIQEHHPNKRPGRLRQGPVHVTSPDDPAVPAYTGPEHGLVPALMQELIQWLNEGDRDSPVHVRASMAHLNLVKIHPWAEHLRLSQNIGGRGRRRMEPRA
ncbi:Fic family protein [Microbispora oryzae]